MASPSMKVPRPPGVPPAPWMRLLPGPAIRFLHAGKRPQALWERCLPQLTTVHLDAAGVEVGAAEPWVTVPVWADPWCSPQTTHCCQGSYCTISASELAQKIGPQLLQRLGAIEARPRGSFTERSRHIVLLVQPRRVYCPWYLIGLSDAQYDRLRQALVARATTA